MIEYVPFEEVTSEHLERIARSMTAAPPAKRFDARELLYNLQSGHWTLFEWPQGVIIVSTFNHRLSLQALCCDNLLKIAVPLTEDLKRLAADWQCDTIETICFDPRLASVICRLGGEVESQRLIVKVE